MVIVFSPDINDPFAWQPVLFVDMVVFVRLNSCKRTMSSADFPRDMRVLRVYPCVRIILLVLSVFWRFAYQGDPSVLIPSENALFPKAPASSVVTESLGLNFPSSKPLAIQSLFAAQIYL